MEAPLKILFGKMSALKQAFASMKWPIDTSWWLMILKQQKSWLANTNVAGHSAQLLEMSGNFNAEYYSVSF